MNLLIFWRHTASFKGLNFKKFRILENWNFHPCDFGWLSRSNESITITSVLVSVQTSSKGFVQCSLCRTHLCSIHHLVEILPCWAKKTFSNSTQLSTEFILLINVKMPTIIGILTFISMINTTSDRLKLKQETSLFVSSWVEISCSFELSMKKFCNLRAWSRSIPFSKFTCPV